MHSTSSRLTLTTLSALAVAALAGTSAHAQMRADLRGTYVLNRATSDDVNRAIDLATRSMNFITRPIARGRLRKTSPVYQKLVLQFDSAQISTALDDRPPISAPASGTVIKWKREDGEVFDLSARWDGAHILQTFRASDGMRENTYLLDPGGNTLKLHVKLSSPRLPRPVEYNLVYNRSP